MPSCPQEGPSGPRAARVASRSREPHEPDVRDHGVRRPRELQRGRRHRDLPRRLPRGRLARRPARARRVDNASSGDDVASDPRRAPGRHRRAVEHQPRLRRGLQPRRAPPTGRRTSPSSTTTPAPTPASCARRSPCCWRAATSGRVATKVLDWDGETIDFVDAAQSWYGQAFKLHVGQPDEPALDVERDVLFGTGSALVVRRSVFDELGGFDRAYFMFFEDVDLGLADLAGRLPGALRARARHVPPPPRVDVVRRQLARAVPARAQRAVDDLQELRRREPGQGAARRPGAERAPRRGAVRGGPDGARPRARQRPRRAGHARGARARCWPRPSPSTPSRPRSAGWPRSGAACRQHRRRPDTEILRLFRSPFQANIPQPGFVQALEEVAGGLRRPLGLRAAQQDRRGDGRHPGRPDGRPGDPRLAHRRGPVAPSTTSAWSPRATAT